MTQAFTHIGIIGKYGADHTGATIERVIALLEKQQLRYTIAADTAPPELKNHSHCRPIKDWQSDIDLAVVIGGDGTFLYAGRMLHAKNIPLVGINAGRLGFLADLSAEHLEPQLSAILSGDYCLETRQILSATIENAHQIRGKFVAINDLVIHKRTMARMVELNTYNRGEFLCHYRADGLILSTPTGSTAYALSAGGPILEPSLDALIIAPICPHTLTHRPVVVGSGSAITITLGDDPQDIQLTIDGQEEFLLQTGDCIHTRHHGKITVLHPSDYRFQHRLRQKLNWGIDPDHPTDIH